MYGPQMGRFTEEGPIGLAGGLHLYRLAGGDPVNFSDPFGLCRSVAGTDPNRIGDCPAHERFVHLMARNLGPWEGPLLVASSVVLAVVSAPVEAASLTLVTLSTAGRAMETATATVAVTNTALRNLLNDIFRARDHLPGGTLGALRAETITGLRTGLKWHIDKAIQTINRLRNIARTQVLTPEEQVLAEALYRDLLDAVRLYLKRRFHVPP